MKAIKFLLILSLVIILQSCSQDKSETSQSATEIKYQILGLDNAISNIKYKDANSNLIEVTDYNQFNNGLDNKTISITTKPFNATMEVNVDNITTSTKVYNLFIYENNVVKAQSTFNIQPMSTSLKILSFVVN